MVAFRVWLISILLIVGAYTALVVRDHGPSLFPQFFGAIAERDWQGQFNLDFMFLLSLSGLWVAWRNRFSRAGIVLGALAFLLGAPFLSAYLLVLLAQAKGDLRRVLLGSAPRES
jgi:hypothetical protein